METKENKEIKFGGFVEYNVILPKNSCYIQIPPWLSLRLIPTFIFQIYPEFGFQTKFPSEAEGLAAWGLKNSDMTFVRREIRTLLYKYVHQGDALVEYH